jgi:hypothetical protein
MAKIAAKGTAFRWTISSVLTTIVQQTEVTAPEAQAQILNVPALDDSVAIDKMPGGYIDYGEARITGFFDPAAATHKALTTDMNALTSRAASVLWSDSAPTSWTFTGYVKSFGASAQESQALRFNATIAVDGAITYPT